MILPLSKAKPYMTALDVFGRAFWLATMSSAIGFASGFLVVYGFFSMIAVLVNSDAGREFAVAAGLFTGGFGTLTGLGMLTKAANQMADIAKDSRNE